MKINQRLNHHPYPKPPLHQSRHYETRRQIRPYQNIPVARPRPPLLEGRPSPSITSLSQPEQQCDIPVSWLNPYRELDARVNQRKGDLINAPWCPKFWFCRNAFVSKCLLPFLFIQYIKFICNNSFYLFLSGFYWSAKADFTPITQVV